MSGKIEKIISRLQEKIAEGQFYEAQQQTRVVAARYIKQENWTAATDILFNVAQSLLKAGQGGSGGDLAIFLVEVYKQAELAPDASNKGKLLTLLRLFEPQEPTKKKFISEMIGWSSKYGDYPAGDPDLHHVAGTLAAEESEAYEAERHLLLGTKDSVDILAKLEYEWFKEDDAHMAPLYAARAVFPYLLLGNVRDASKAFTIFASRVSEEKSLAAQVVSVGGATTQIYPSLPLFNFLGLLLLAIQKGSAEHFRQLKGRYSTHIKEVGSWDEALDLIAEMYFGVAPPRQSNPLLDMMGSMFGGGGGAPKKQTTKRVTAPAPAPPAEGLD